MAKQSNPYSLLILTLFLLTVQTTTQVIITQLHPSQSWSLLQIKRQLNYPPILKSWRNNTDFCKSKPNPFATVVCYGNSVTQLHITGKQGNSSPVLPKNFSIESFFTTLTRLPDLKVLTLASLGLWGPLPVKISRLSSLEILNMSSNFLYGSIPREVSNLTNLQTMILDHNSFNGSVPSWLNLLELLAVLSLKNNSFDGTLPNSLSNMGNLRKIVLSSNNLSGNLPDFSNLTNLEVLDLENNSFGPQFPKLGMKLVTITLKLNKFGSGIPAVIGSYNFLQRIDLSFNKFVGPFPVSLLSLPSIKYINIAANRFTGMLFQNISCNDQIEFVDLSFNLLTGNLPSCLDLGSKEKSVFYSENCLTILSDPSQHPVQFCQNQALAVGILPKKERKKFLRKGIIVIGVTFGVIVSALIVGLSVFFFRRKKNNKRVILRPPRRLKEQVIRRNSSNSMTDSRYISHTIKLGALGIPSYRTFSLDEIESATNNFETSSFIGECSNGQMYRGIISDGSMVAIKCLKLKRSQPSLNFKNQIEIISKLRHRHLASALGHCFEFYLDDSTVSRVFFVFEYVSGRNLRRKISQESTRQRLTWAQRISAAIGIAKGIQFLHGGIIPGLFGNNLKISNVLLDQNFVAKISTYNLPVLEQSMQTEGGAGGSSNESKESIDRVKQGEKIDVYDFGVILLEIVCGRPITSHCETEIMKNKLQSSLTGDRSARKNFVDPIINKSCSDESIKTVMEICLRCLSKEPAQRPSVEDVLWNLQFAAQVVSRSCEQSPLSPSRPPRVLSLYSAELEF